VIQTLKQTGMILVLVLLSEGLFVLCSGIGRGGARESAGLAAMKLLAGTALCSSALMLLYSLGTRDEE
jgi:hypothetical protein